MTIKSEIVEYAQPQEPLPQYPVLLRAKGSRAVWLVASPGFGVVVWNDHMNGGLSVGSTASVTFPDWPEQWEIFRGHITLSNTEEDKS